MINPKSEQKKIGQFVAELREKRNITQKELAKALKTSQSAVARMEKGEQNFSTEMLSKISRALDRDIITLSSGAINFQIEGGKKLSGTVEVRTSKNAAVALLCASLLNKGKTTLKNMPRIEEVGRIIEVLSSIGVKVKRDGSNVEIEPPKNLKLKDLNEEAAKKTRSVIMLIPSLAHLIDKFSLPHPGGCKIGRRSIRPHMFTLENFGIKTSTQKDYYEITTDKFKPAEFVLYESGDTVTENAIMAAAKIDGISKIKFASANYQVQDLCLFLEKLGVEIEGIGTTTITIRGKSEIDQPVTYSPGEDPIEAMLFLSIAATTNSSITIKKCPIDFLELELLKLEKMGFKYEILEKYKSENGFTNLVDIKTYPSRLKALEEKIYARPFPGLNIDNLPFFVPIATRAKGTTLIHDWVYETRAIYYLELSKLGANVILADPHRVYIEGPTELRGAEIICPPALRPAAIILIAMLSAKGTSILRNVYSINRGYEDLASRLNKIGARIKIIKGI